MYIQQSSVYFVHIPNLKDFFAKHLRTAEEEMFMLYRSLIAISSSSLSINIVVTAFDYANEREWRISIVTHRERKSSATCLMAKVFPLLELLAFMG